METTQMAHQLRLSRHREDTVNATQPVDGGKAPWVLIRNSILEISKWTKHDKEQHAWPAPYCVKRVGCIVLEHAQTIFGRAYKTRLCHCRWGKGAVGECNVHISPLYKLF